MFILLFIFCILIFVHMFFKISNVYILYSWHWLIFCISILNLFSLHFFYNKIFVSIFWCALDLLGLCAYFRQSTLFAYKFGSIRHTVISSSSKRALKCVHEKSLKYKIRLHFGRSASTRWIWKPVLCEYEKTSCADDFYLQ